MAYSDRIGNESFEDWRKRMNNPRVRTADGQYIDPAELSAEDAEVKRNKEQRLRDEQQPNESNEDYAKRAERKVRQSIKSGAEVMEYDALMAKASKNMEIAARLKAEPHCLGKITAIIDEGSGLEGATISFDVTHPLAPNNTGTIIFRANRMRRFTGIFDDGGQPEIRNAGKLEIGMTGLLDNYADAIQLNWYFTVFPPSQQENA